MNLGRCFASPTRTRREVDSSLVSTYRGRPETWRGGPERMRDFETSPGNHARMVQSEPPEINAPDGRREAIENCRFRCSVLLCHHLRRRPRRLC